MPRKNQPPRCGHASAKRTTARVVPVHRTCPHCGGLGNCERTQPVGRGRGNKYKRHYQCTICRGWWRVVVTRVVMVLRVEHIASE